MCLWSGLRGLSEGAHIHHRSLILTALTETEKEETESRPFWAAQSTSSSSCKHVLIKMVASVIKLNLVFMIYELWSYHINDDCEHVMMSSQTFLWRAAPTTPVWTWAAPSFHGGKLTRRSCTYSLLCSTIKTIRRIMILLTNNFLSDCAFQFFLQKKNQISFYLNIDTFALAVSVGWLWPWVLMGFSSTLSMGSETIQSFYFRIPFTDSRLSNLVPFFSVFLRLIQGQQKRNNLAPNVMATIKQQEVI